jgi:hypothetical protein
MVRARNEGSPSIIVDTWLDGSDVVGRVTYAGTSLIPHPELPRRWLLDRGSRTQGIRSSLSSEADGDRGEADAEARFLQRPTGNRPRSGNT